MKTKIFIIIIMGLGLIWAPLKAHAEGAPPGLTGGPLDSSNAGFSGHEEEGEAGYSVAIVGDVNGDGYADILSGAPGNGEIGDYPGYAYLNLGGPVGWALMPEYQSYYSDQNYYGESGGDRAGFSVAGAGDINGDGFDDMLISAPYWNGGAGRVYLILGKSDILGMDMNLADADAIFSGSGGELAGYQVAGAGDVNRDGFDDMLIGAPNNDVVYLVLGDPTLTSIDLSNADVIFSGEYVGDSTGFSVSGAGDVNGDGFDDLLIGAPNYNFDEGRAYLVFGSHVPSPYLLNLSNADRIYSGTSGQSLGWSVAGAGDVNGDGFSDVLISFVTTTGGAYLVLGSSTPKLNCTLDICTDEGYRGSAYSATGGRVAGAGDVNGDGYADLIIGACSYPDSNSRGQVSLILGHANPNGVKDLDTDADANYLGMADNDIACIVGAGTGDVNGDNLSDFVIGSPGQADNDGYVYVLFGDDTTSTAARYRRMSASGIYNSEIGSSGVSADVSSSWGGSLYVTRYQVNTCGRNFTTNGLLWEVDSQVGDLAEVQLSFKYNDTQIAGWNEADLKLWYRERPCQEWMQDTGATLDQNTNQITSSLVYAPHREYTIAPGEPSPTQLGLTGFGASTSRESPWQIIGLFLLIVLTVVVNGWQKRIWREKEI